MNIVNGAQLRALTNLNLRNKPDVNAQRLATIQTGVIVQALAPPVNGWLYCVVHGWEHPDHPGDVFSEPHTQSSLEARRGVLGWHAVALEGYASMAQAAWWEIVDGPQEAV